MLTDLRTDTFSTEPLDTDVCIIGAGAAGITIAGAFAGSKTRVILVESGGFDFDEATHNLQKGYATGNIPHNDGYLRWSRLRYFGGSTNHWTGWCRPLDPIDFSKRSWIPYSGWPISREKLEPYYRKAEKMVEIQPFLQFDDRYNSQKKGNNHDFRAPWFQFSPPTRFGKKYRNRIIKADNIHLMLYANVNNIRLSESKNKVDTIRVQSLNKNTRTIRPRFLIIACGGIENPRILLNCRDDMPAGIGNQNNLLGRFFMEHPHYSEAGVLLPGRSNHPFFRSFYRSDHNNADALRVFSPSESLQQREGLLNSGFQAVAVAEGSESSELTLATGALSGKTIFREGDDSNGKLESARLLLRAEQYPDPGNAVTLLPEIDAAGLQKVALKCNVSAEEVEKNRMTLQFLAQHLGLNRKARLRIDLRRESNVTGGANHMGTTRMSDDPGQGVVNRNCRIHGISNLYVAGSSVFPTGGFANPTLTIVALSLRLSDHLKQTLHNA